MNQHHRAISVQQRLSSLRKRLQAVEHHVASNEWPYAALGNIVPAYVTSLAKTIRLILVSTAEEVLLTEALLDSPVAELHQARLTRHFTERARKQNVSPKEIADAVFASCETSIRTASNMVAHLEACIEGEQTIDGRVLTPGALWNK